MKVNGQNNLKSWNIPYMFIWMYRCKYMLYMYIRNISDHHRNIYIFLPLATKLIIHKH